MMRLVFREARIVGVQVYEIGTVDVPSSHLDALGLENGNRGRVIALSEALNTGLGVLGAPVTCIADKDFLEVVAEAGIVNPILRFTDHACMEGYWWENTTIERLCLSFGCEQAVEDVSASVLPIVHELFLMRAASRKLGWELRALDVEKRCREEAGGLKCDLAAHLRAYLGTRAAVHREDEFVGAMEGLRPQVDGMGPRAFNGHDLTHVLGLHLRIGQRCRDATEVVVRGRMLSALDGPKIRASRLFASLRNTYGRG